MGFQAFMARQLARPSGLWGTWVMAGLLDRGNREMNLLALRQLAPSADDRVLEIGFGGGDLLARMLAGPCAFAAGLELSPEMAARAGRRLRSSIRSGRAELRVGSISAIPWSDDAFTRVVSVNTLYFWPDPARALAECRRVLTADGALVLCFNPRHELEKWPGHRHGFTLYSVDDVRALLAAHGFAVQATDTAVDPRQGEFVSIRATPRG